MQPHAQELFFNLFYTFACKKIFFLPPQNFPGKIREKYMENLNKRLEKFKHCYRPQNFLVESGLCCVALV